MTRTTLAAAAVGLCLAFALPEDADATRINRIGQKSGPSTGGVLTALKGSTRSTKVFGAQSAASLGRERKSRRANNSLRPFTTPTDAMFALPREGAFRKGPRKPTPPPQPPVPEPGTGLLLGLALAGLGWMGRSRRP